MGNGKESARTRPAATVLMHNFKKLRLRSNKQTWCTLIGIREVFFNSRALNFSVIQPIGILIFGNC